MTLYYSGTDRRGLNRGGCSTWASPAALTRALYDAGFKRTTIVDRRHDGDQIVGRIETSHDTGVGREGGVGMTLFLQVLVVIVCILAGIGATAGAVIVEFKLLDADLSTGSRLIRTIAVIAAWALITAILVTTMLTWLPNKDGTVYREYGQCETMEEK